MKKMLPLLLALAFILCRSILPGQNVALDFDGSGDFITVTPITGWAPNSDFTFEAWFTASPDGLGCTSNFRRLFALSVPSRFEVGQCGGQLYLFWNDGAPNSHFQISTGSINILDGAWHCMSVVRRGALVDIYLDGGLVYSVSNVGTLNSSLFRVGHWGGGTTPTQDWLGHIDEVRLWNVALPASQLMSCSNCLLTGAEPGLIVYWRLDDGTPSLPNNNTTVADASASGANPGVLNPLSNGGHGLTGPVGNFVLGAPIVYPDFTNHSVFISDPIQMVGIAWVCNGASVHFSLLDFNGNTPQPGGGVTVAWQYSDDQWATWTLIPSLGGFQFGVPANTATAITCPSPTGFVDREFRAIITATSANGTCVFTSQPALLRIYCEIGQVNVQATPSIPAPLCEGDQASFTVSVTTNLPGPDPANDVHIDWCISTDGGATWLILPYSDQTGFVYPTITAGMQDICFKAIVNNGACGVKTGQVCVKVDPKPVCGGIIGWPTPANLTLVASTPWLMYEICPGEDATVGMDPSMLPFQSCNPQWQYSFGDSNNPNTPSLWTWVNLGFSNSLQNTNILPTTLWGTNTSIYYRIECLPLSIPSGCAPCYSNIVEIKLKPAPPAPTIVAVPPNQTICYGDAVGLFASNDPGTVTTWYCNGEAVATGPIYSASNQACYWTEVTDGCYILRSDPLCLTVCVAVAKITCPSDNPCIIPNIPITLSGLDSYSVNCGPIVMYQWEVEFLPQPNSSIYFFNTPTVTFTPPAAGAIVTLTVADSNGCVHSVQSYFKPCQP
jgi:hypothetical protein